MERLEGLHKLVGKLFQTFEEAWKKALEKAGTGHKWQDQVDCKAKKEV